MFCLLRKNQKHQKAILQLLVYIYLWVAGVGVVLEQSELRFILRNQGSRDVRRLEGLKQLLSGFVDDGIRVVEVEFGVVEMYLLSSL